MDYSYTYNEIWIICDINGEIHNIIQICDLADNIDTLLDDHRVWYKAFCIYSRLCKDW